MLLTRQAAELAASMALRNPLIHQPIVIPAAHPGNIVFVPHPPGIQFRTTRATVPVPNSFVPMQVTRQSVHQQPRIQSQPGPHPPASASSPSTNKPIETPKIAKEKSEPSSQANESPKSAGPSVTSKRPPNQERPIPGSKPPGSRLAIRFNGP